MTDKDIKTALEHVKFRKTKKEQILEKLLSECEVKSRKEIISIRVSEKEYLRLLHLSQFCSCCQEQSMRRHIGYRQKRLPGIWAVRNYPVISNHLM